MGTVNGSNQVYASDVATYEDADYVTTDVVKLRVYEEDKTDEAKDEV